MGHQLYLQLLLHHAQSLLLLQDDLLNCCFALSQAPPAFAMKSAIRTPVTNEPASSPPNAFQPNAKPTITGAETATNPGPTISFNAA